MRESHPHIVPPGEIEVFTICRICGRSLPVAVSYDGQRFISKEILFYHDRRGIFCPSCTPDKIAALPGDDREARRDPIGREKVIIDALKLNQDGMSAAQITRHTGIVRSTLIRRLDGMMQHGKIQRGGKKYFLNNNNARLIENDASDMMPL